jgi:hypothetical protein
MIRGGIDISSDYMTAVYGGDVIATARFGKHAAADGPFVKSWRAEIGVTA